MTLKRPGWARLVLVLGLPTFVGAAAAAQGPPPSSQGAPSAGSVCRVHGRVTSGNQPLPGVSLIVRAGDALKAATSTGVDGQFVMIFGANATYQVTADL